MPARSSGPQGQVEVQGGSVGGLGVPEGPQMLVGVGEGRESSGGLCSGPSPAGTQVSHLPNEEVGLYRVGQK